MLSSMFSRKSNSHYFHAIIHNPKASFSIALLLVDAFAVSLIIAFVPYTKIDWDAYMSQVSGFLKGERDYMNLKGDTGPLVYPAGFLYIYSAIQFVTGGEVCSAQILFGVLYIINLAIVLFIYVKTDAVPWWAPIILSMSRRVHSIFVLRLFNDCIAMTLLHTSIAVLIYDKWCLALIIFSGAVSVKMNVLLFAPSLLLLMLKVMDLYGVVLALTSAAIVQILLGLPFILSHPASYFSRAFDLSRVFIYFWSVNFKFLPESVFVSKEFAVFLLISHLALLTLFAHYKWCKYEDGIFCFSKSIIRTIKLKFFNVPTFISKSLPDSGSKVITKEHIVTTMFAGNFIGIVCARSLHYQFYSWYFYSLPYLLWKTQFPTFLRLMVMMGVEVCWNIYPSTPTSSALLLCMHVMILCGMFLHPSQHPYHHHHLIPPTRKPPRSLD